MHADLQLPPPVPARTPQAAPKAPAAPSTTALDGLSYTQLKSRQDELQDQRQLLADRRSTVASTYERATGANKEGIAARLVVMDRSMAQIESDLSAVGLAMVPRRPVTGTTSTPPINQRRSNIGAAEVLLVGAGVFLATMLVAVPAAVRRAKRRWLRESPSSGTNGIGVGSERLDRIEHAVDAIAIEIERVSENQRFMTRLMTETQLAGTLAAVRGSAAAAKSEVG
jgi:hypothetical protein